MILTFACPHCESPQRISLDAGQERLQCGHCDWSRDISEGDLAEDAPARCLACGCHDLWKQKDFPAWLGLLMVAGGAILSTVAWAYIMPKTAIGILMGFAFVDLVFYTMMPDVLVCYRCRARHAQAKDPQQHPKFSPEVMERYRQERLRQQDHSEARLKPPGAAEHEKPKTEHRKPTGN